MRGVTHDYRFAVGSRGTTTPCARVGAARHRRDDELSQSRLQFNGHRCLHRCPWRKGTKESLSARFAVACVVPAHEDGVDPDERERVGLLIEWRHGEERTGCNAECIGYWTHTPGCYCRIAAAACCWPGRRTDVEPLITVCAAYSSLPRAELPIGSPGKQGTDRTGRDWPN